MPVDTQHREYAENLSIWQQVRDCDAGAKAIKSRAALDGSTNSLGGMAGTAYLPAPNASDISIQNRERFIAYLKRAIFVNFTGATKEAILGLVFRKNTEIKTPKALEHMIDDVNGGGLSVDQLIKDVVSDVTMIGRMGLFVDYPVAQKGMTKAQVDALGLRANIVTYIAENIINWKTEMIGGVTKLTMVVLREPTEKVVDEFKSEVVNYHRVLLLRDGVYVINLYNDDNELVPHGEGENAATDMIPTDHSGKTWDEIPFIFPGSLNNDPTVDKSPMYDISEVNIGHYHNSADYEESSFLTGQPTPVVTGLSAAWAKEFLKDGFALGSRGGIPLPVGGDAKLLQADPNSQPLGGMKHKEAQLIQLGARLITDTGSNETVDAARMRYAGQNSKIGSITTNVEEALEKCFGWSGRYMGTDEPTEIDINKELYDRTIDPQMLMALIQLTDRGTIAETDLRGNLRRGNLIDADRTDDDINADAESTDPLAGAAIQPPVDPGNNSDV